MRRLLAAALGALALAGAVRIQAQDRAAADSAVWRKVQASLFAGEAIAVDDDVIALDVPKRAEDAAIVPVAIHARIPQAAERYIDRVWLVVDDNPSPVAAVFAFTRAAGRADIETRIRIEQYTWVRAIARTSDGALHMATSYVKASGGCSAPAGKDAQAARADLGRMRLRVSDDRSQPTVIAQLMVRHPNESGLAMDQVTRTYATPHFVRRLDVTYAGQPLLGADLDFAISENPNFRFSFEPGNGGELEARVVDNQDLSFSTRLHVDPSTGDTAASSLR